MKDNIYCVRMSVYGCSPKCCILNMCGVLELLENCFVIEIQMYNKRFAFASMSTRRCWRGEQIHHNIGKALLSSFYI